jgi:predicted nucleic acid-binding protein
MGRAQNPNLDFHFNAALTTVSLAKVADYLSENEQETNEKTLNSPFSTDSFKVLYFNDLMLNRFLGIFGICTKQAHRKKRKIKLPDALILATARHLEAALLTRNLKDFKGLDEAV